MVEEEKELPKFATEEERELRCELRCDTDWELRRETEQELRWLLDKLAGMHTAENAAFRLAVNGVGYSVVACVSVSTEIWFISNTVGTGSLFNSSDVCFTWSLITLLIISSIISAATYMQS